MCAVVLPKVVDVFLLAENRLLREALTKILKKKNNIRVVGAACFSPEALKQITDVGTQVLIVDSAAFTFSGVPIITTARKEIPGLKVVMVGMESDKEIFLRTVRAGISGYLLKDASASEIAEAVRTVATGQEAVCPPILCLALFEYAARQSTQFPFFFSNPQLGLSRREQELVQLISYGLSNKQIANQLNLSDQTVKNHIHRILRKLNASDRLAAVEVCRAQGMSA